MAVQSCQSVILASQHIEKYELADALLRKKITVVCMQPTNSRAVYIFLCVYSVRCAIVLSGGLDPWCYLWLLFSPVGSRDIRGYTLL